MLRVKFILTLLQLPVNLDADYTLATRIRRVLTVFMDYA